MSQVIQAADRVLIHFSVFLDDESIADSTYAMGKPALIQLGDGSFSDVFEEKLLGLEKGSKTKFRLDAKDAFGESNPALIQFMDTFSFSQEMDLKPDLVVSFSQPNGEQMPGIIRSIEGTSVKVDFNHPLAGEAATFQIEIIDINPAFKKATPTVGDIPLILKEV
ncbi:MAG: peptidylprolyl isomerase [Gammaproteobacteria bacterium CG22_combo_CG10-13_8_21_14_all_40_8]|nr:MAG: peptidylprolyl isomerase [Gammaproteobacteria bacterium CG22_combo_CG10-13_8_21_14_all_40_8]